MSFTWLLSVPGFRPIIGCEAYVAPNSLRERNASTGKEAAFHLTLLATDAAGYPNLVKLVTAAHLEGFYYKPRIDKDLLAIHSGGLIALSGCLKANQQQASFRRFCRSETRRGRIS